MTSLFSDYHFFWDGPFSQWCESDFVVDGQLYTHAEQWMMVQKALLFGDGEIPDPANGGKPEKASTLILAAWHPGMQKKLGRLIPGFDVEIWSRHARNIVLEGSWHKFGQNADLYADLMGTEGKLIVEASPEDGIWGIKLGPADPRRLDPAEWRGTNWLGQVLTYLRLCYEQGETELIFPSDWDSLGF